MCLIYFKNDRQLINIPINIIKVPLLKQLLYLICSLFLYKNLNGENNSSSTLFTELLYMIRNALIIGSSGGIGKCLYNEFINLEYNVNKFLLREN